MVIRRNNCHVEKNKSLEQLVRREEKEEVRITMQCCHTALRYLTNKNSTTKCIYTHIGEIDSSTIKSGSIYMD
ncbi:MAG: hypothetical protein ACTS7E_02755 [Arsenophonus sp. NC-CH8-MAG3]